MRGWRPKGLVAAGIGTAIFVLLLTWVAAAVAGNLDPQRMVLTLQDLPTGFRLSSSRHVSPKDVANARGASVNQVTGWGFLGGYSTAYFEYLGASKVAVGIGSGVTVYRTATGAEASLLKASCPPDTHEVSVGARIGDEAHLCAATGAGAYLLSWRRGRIVAQVSIGGISPLLASPTAAIRLALRQDKRMR
jgi:hypothetical protein